MTPRTLMYFAAALAFHMAAGPVLAGSTVTDIVPRMHFVDRTETPTRAGRAPQPSCTSLEKAVKLDPDQCGAYSRRQLRKMKAQQGK